MATLGIAIIFGLILCGLAWKANERLKNENRLPMQWWLTGEITWSAPRPLALAFIPALAIVVLAIYIVSALTVRPRVGQETDIIPAVIGLGAIFIAIQLAHLWLIARTLRRNGN